MSQQPNVKLPPDQHLFEMIQEYFPDLEITLFDLKNPTHVHVCKFYTALLEELGANPTNMMQVSTIFIYHSTEIMWTKQCLS